MKPQKHLLSIRERVQTTIIANHHRFIFNLFIHVHNTFIVYIYIYIYYTFIFIIYSRSILNKIHNPYSGICRYSSYIHIHPNLLLSEDTLSKKNMIFPCPNFWHRQAGPGPCANWWRGDAPPPSCWTRRGPRWTGPMT